MKWIKKVKDFFIRLYLWIKEKTIRVAVTILLILGLMSAPILYDATQQSTDGMIYSDATGAWLNHSTIARSKNLTMNYEDYVQSMISDNQIILKTGTDRTAGGTKTYFLVPWFAGSGSNAVGNLRSNCNIQASTPSFDSFCLVTDEVSQGFLIISNSRNSTLLNIYVQPMLNTINALNRRNAYYDKSGIKLFNFGPQMAWQFHWENNYLNISTDTRTLYGTGSDENSAIDADYRTNLALMNLMHNPALTNATLKSQIAALAEEYCYSFIEYPGGAGYATHGHGALTQHTYTSQRTPGYVMDYWQPAGVKNTMNGGGGLTEYQVIYPGYMFDGALTMTACYQNFNDSRFLKAAGDLVEHWLLVTNYTGTGFRAHAGIKGKMSSVTSNAYYICQDQCTYGGGLCQENADAVRFHTMGLVRKAEIELNTTIHPRLALLLADFKTAATAQNKYSTSGFARNWCEDGTIGNTNDGNTINLGFGAYNIIGDASGTSLVHTFHTTMLGRFNGVKFSDAQAMGIYFYAFPVNSLGMGLYLHETMQTAGEYEPPVDPPVDPPVGVSDAVCRYIVSGSGCFYSNGTEISLAAAQWPIVNFTSCNATMCTNIPSFGGDCEFTTENWTSTQWISPTATYTTGLTYQQFYDEVLYDGMAHENYTRWYYASDTGTTMLLTPDTAGSNLCKATDFKQASLTGLTVGINDSFEWRGDRSTEVGIALSMGSNETIFDGWYNGMEHPNFTATGLNGSLAPCLSVYSMSLREGQLVKLSSDSAIDVVRKALAYFYASGNPAFGDANRLKYYNSALCAINASNTNEWLHLGTSTMNTPYGPVNKIPFGGRGAASGAFTAPDNHMWMGYFDEPILINMYAYLKTGNQYYYDYAETAAKVFLTIELQNSTNAFGTNVYIGQYRNVSGNLQFHCRYDPQTGLREKNECDVGNNQWDRADRPRAQWVCHAPYLFEKYNGTLSGIWKNLSDWCSAGVVESEKLDPFTTYSLRVVYYNGTVGATAGEAYFHATSLGMAYSHNTSMIAPKSANALAKYSRTYNTFDNDANGCRNIFSFEGAHATQILGHALGYDELFLESTPIPGSCQ
jgi:hypothetical protein